MDAAILVHVAVGFRDERLDEVDTEESEEVDERCYEREDGGEFGEGEHMKRDGVSDLLAPPVEEEVGDGEEESEENAVG